MRYFFPIIFFIIAIPASALTDVVLNDPTALTSYQIPLSYDDTKETIRPSTASTSQYLIVRGPFMVPPRAFESPFLGILIGPNETVFQQFGIPLPENIVTGSVMAYSVPAPYYPSGERLDVYKGGLKLFSIDLSASRICIEDGRCDFAVGESEQNCQADCANIPLPPKGNVTEPMRPTPTITPGALPPVVQVGSLEEPSGDPSTNMLAGLFLVLGLTSFGFWMYLRKKGRVQ